MVVEFDPSDCDYEDYGVRNVGHNKRTLGELLEGTTFDIDEKNDEEEEEATWWSREEAMKYLEMKENETDSFNPTESFDELIQDMIELEKDLLWKKTIRMGTGNLIDSSKSIVYHYQAFLEGCDEPFDSTILRDKPFLHRLNHDNVFRGLFHGFLSMREHEKAAFICKSQLAFGELGCPPRIPGNASICFIVEILKVYDEGSLQSFDLLNDEERSKYSFEDIMELVNRERISGNTYFKDEKYKDAAQRYRRAINFLERYTYKDKEEERQGHEILSKLYPNIAQSYNKTGRYLPAMSNCRRALDINRNNVKALYHYGNAKFLNGNYEEAQRYFLMAKKISPLDKYINRGLMKTEERLRRDSQVSDDLFKKMYQGI